MIAARSDEPLDYDVVIIGAGAAGLAAAAVLGAAGRRVLLLDARDRIGGRAFSAPVPDSSMPVEYGPEFIHGTPEVSLRLLQQHGIARVDAAAEDWTYGSAGLELDHDEAAPEEALFAAAATLAADDDCSVEDALHALPPQIDRAAISERIRRMVNGFDAADPRDASLRAIVEEWQGDANLQTPASRPVGGYRALWQAMQAALPADLVELQLQAVVTRVARSPDFVEVSLRQPLRPQRRVRAAAVLITVSIGVLQAPPGSEGAIEFEPPLPVATQHALKSLAMGPVIKIIAQFATPFWEELHYGAYYRAAFFHGPENGDMRTFWTTLPTRSSLLTGWIGGADAQAIMDRPSAVHVENFVSQIQELFRLPSPIVPKRIYYHDWQRDPFARGAYSYVRVGGLAARRALRDPIDGRVWLAGEALAEQGEGGTVAGALSTGEAAAYAALASIVP